MPKCLVQSGTERAVVRSQAIAGSLTTSGPEMVYRREATFDVEISATRTQPAEDSGPQPGRRIERSHLVPTLASPQRSNRHADGTRSSELAPPEVGGRSSPVQAAATGL